MNAWLYVCVSVIDNEFRFLEAIKLSCSQFAVCTLLKIVVIRNELGTCL